MYMAIKYKYMAIKLLFVKSSAKILLIKSLIYLKELNSPPAISLILSTVFISVCKSFKALVQSSDVPLGGVDAPAD